MAQATQIHCVNVVDFGHIRRPLVLSIFVIRRLEQGLHVSHFLSEHGY
jgi:hypothetical protein